MKKSNALMLSYMIFLAIALLAKIIFKWDGLDQIAMGATIAGCFFAFADLANWHVSNSAMMLDALQKEQNVFKVYCATRLKKLTTWQQEAEEIKVKMDPYSVKYKSAEELCVLCANRAENLAQGHVDLTKKVDDGLTKLQNMLNKENSKIAVFRAIDIALITLGFIVFFVLITFKLIATFLADYQAHATIIAFIVIMLNYFLRDIIDENIKEEVEEILAKTDELKSTIHKTEEEIKKMPLLDKANKLIEQLEDLEKKKGNFANE